MVEVVSTWPRAGSFVDSRGSYGKDTHRPFYCREFERRDNISRPGSGFMSIPLSSSSQVKNQVLLGESLDQPIKVADGAFVRHADNYAAIQEAIEFLAGGFGHQSTVVAGG